MRFLRHYISKARRTHFCDYCMHYIESGERYEAHVFADKKSRIWVMKQHYDGCPVDPWEEEAEMLGSLTKTIDMVVEDDKELTEAA